MTIVHIYSWTAYENLETSKAAKLTLFLFLTSLSCTAFVFAGSQLSFEQINRSFWLAEEGCDLYIFRAKTTVKHKNLLSVITISMFYLMPFISSVSCRTEYFCDFSKPCMWRYEDSRLQFSCMRNSLDSWTEFFYEGRNASLLSFSGHELYELSVFLPNGLVFLFFLLKGDPLNELYNFICNPHVLGSFDGTTSSFFNILAMQFLNVR